MSAEALAKADAGEGGGEAAGRGVLSANAAFEEATPLPSELVARAGVALSRRGRGHINWHAKEKVRGGSCKMSARYEELKGLKNLGQKYAYSDREVMLYAYGIGLGADPMDEKELAFVNEACATPRSLKVVPTFASVAAWGAGPGEMNLNRVLVVDGERDITFHQPLATAANTTADSSVREVYDKGKDKGVVINHQTVLKNEKGEKLATLVASRFARGDGGFGGPNLPQPEPHKMPSRA